MDGDAEQKGIVSLNSPATPETEGHICRLCDCPDHRACGCEAKAAKDIEQQGGIATPGTVAIKLTTDALTNLAENLVKKNKDLQADKDVAELLLENRDAQLAAQRDIVEQLKIIAEHLGELVAQKKMVESIKTGGLNGN